MPLYEVAVGADIAQMTSTLNCLGRFWRFFTPKSSRRSQADSHQQRAVAQTIPREPSAATNNDETPILEDVILDNPALENVSRQVPGIQIQIRQPTLPTGHPGVDRTPSPQSFSLFADWDATSHRSRAYSSGSNTSAEHWLKDQFDSELYENHFDKFKSIVPRCAIDRLVTVDAVSKDILKSRTINEDEVARCAHQVCKDAKYLYAVLAYMKKGADVCQFLAEGITDADLPLVRKGNVPRKLALYRRQGDGFELVKAMESWADKHLRKFDQYQWWMRAPTFKSLDHHDFDDDDVLPFVALKEEEKQIPSKQGSYSEVFPVRIHPAHHDFWESSCSVDDERLVAVKQLFSDDEQEFMKEVSILKAVGPKNHPHLIKLLATYKHKKKYHLLFPYAKANLRTYWEEHKMPAFDRPTLLWSLKQMEGIASGLNLIHNFSVTYPLSVSGAGKPGDDNVRLPKDAKLSVKKGEEMYGRHGDIKPENVLWFADEDNETGSVMGTLQIADFGLGRFHGRDSRSGIPAYGIFSSPTYEPPECKLHLPVSRAYDIWSLGCIYLEFVTWLLEGSAQIDGFANFRGRIATATGINDDNFFTVITNIQGSRAVVRDSVVTWSNRLHSHPKCTKVLHDLLDFIMKELLVVESKDRCNASILFQHLTWFRTRAEKDAEYLLEPDPRQVNPRSGRHNSTGAIEIAPRSPKRTSIQFSEGEKTGPKPKDLVLRNAGTPKPNLGHPLTWPDQRMDE